MTIGDGVDPRHLDDARCVDLVLGLLPAEDRAAALAHAFECRACETRLRAHVGATERARADRPRVLSEPVGVRPRAARTRWAVALAAAAALVAVVALPPILGRRAPEPPRSWLPAPGEPVATREGESEDPHLTAGLAAYAAHDLARAGRELEEARASGPTEAMRRMYLADVRLSEGDARTATELLRGLEWRDIPEPWRHEGVALYARALRHAGHGATADSIEHALRTRDPASPVVP